ncbi:MAG: hypothetical protein CMH56_01065 [Myxococcales bacterium]|nr:hypothetical protein [Myxococcales bacterium]|tara:strand:+ start:5463 stop:6614 length:1152 start_codon:yes stop_codon:yes gene_type:complete
MVNTSEEVEQKYLPRALPIFSRFPELKKILIYWALSRLVLTIAAGASRIFFDIQKGHFGNPFIDAWAIWDSGWYLNIAENGYSAHTSERGQASYAFFPLYAWLIRCLGFVLQNDVIAGVVISNISFIVACFAFYRWARLEHDDATSETMLITLVMFPASFIFTAVMTEGLFVALAIMCLLAARKGFWGWAALCALAAVLTRSMGVFLVVPLAYEIIRKHRSIIVPQVLWLGIPPLGWVIVGIINYQAAGDAFAWVEIQKQAWQHVSTFPLSVIWDGFFTPEEPAFAFNSAYSLVVGLLIVVSFKYLRLGDYGLSLIFFFLPLCSGIVTLYSMVRYSAVVFPLFILIGIFLHARPKYKIGIWVLCGGLQVLFMILWSTGSYFII